MHRFAGVAQAVGLLFCILLAAVHASSVAYVSAVPDEQATGLLPALQGSAETIVLKTNYSVADEFKQYYGSPLPINRNVTITSLPGQMPCLDLQFQTGILELCSTCTFTFSAVCVGNGTHIATVPIISFLRGPVGSRVVHEHGYGMGLVCTPTPSSLTVIDSRQHSALAPGPIGSSQQLAFSMPTTTFQGKTYHDMLYAEDISSDVPLTLVEGSVYVGGYVLARKNTTRLCDHIVSQECIKVKSPENCVRELTLQVLAAAAGAGSRQGIAGAARAAAIAVPVAAGAMILAAAIAVLLVRHRKRKLRDKEAAAAAPGSKQHSDGAAAAAAAHGFGSSGRSPAGDCEMQAELLSSSGQQSASPAGSRTCRRPSAMGSAWELKSSHTSPFLDWNTSDSTIHFGELLGAGGFARVFRATWAGLEVAVKIIQHDSGSVAAVENEVSLMMSLNHPNIVRAYHCVTHQRKRPAPSAGAGATVAAGSSNPLQIVVEQPSSNAGRSSSSGGAGRVSSSGSSRLQQLLPGKPALNSSSNDVLGVPDNHHPQQPPHQLLSPSAPASAALLQPPTPVSAAPQPNPMSPTTNLSILLPTSSNVGAMPSLDTAGPQSLSETPRATNGVSLALDPAGSRSSLGLHPARSSAAAGVEAGTPNNPYATPRVTPGTTSQGWPVIENSPIVGAGGAGGNKCSADSVAVETWLVQELCDRGTLSSVASHWQPSSEGDDQMLQRLLLMQDCVRGLALLHSKNVVHGDLNAHNVLVSSSSTARYGMVGKLADLGLSRVLKQRATHRTTRTMGTLSHQPPELLQYGRLSPAVDIYSFGIMMWELYLGGQQAFRHLHYGQIFNTVVLLGLRPPVPPNMPDDYQLLMERCWAAEPADRPSVEQLLECLSLMVQDREHPLQQHAQGSLD